MQRLRTKWKFDCLQPGFLFLCALLLVDLSFLCYQSTHWSSQLICVLLAAYLLGLLWHKYRQLAVVVSIILVAAGITFKLDRHETYFTLNSTTQVLLYPDEVKVRGNWLSGVGRNNGGQVLISTPLSKAQLVQLKQGQEVCLSKLNGEVKPLMPATNYGQFDLRKYYAAQNITQQVVLKSCQMTIIQGNWLAQMHHLRFELQAYFSHLPPILGFFSSELILGEALKQSDQALLNNYRDLGVIHLLSISGLHVGLYTLVLSTLCFACKLTEGETFVCCLGLLSSGIFLSHGQAGFIRASLTYLLGKSFSFKRWPITPLDLLGLTCLLHLFIDPRLMMNVGALLSYVLALGLELTKKMPRWQQAVALNGLLTPLLLFFFCQFNLLTVLFNMVVVPYFNWLVVPITFLNLLLFPCWPAASRLLEEILQTGEQVLGQVAATKVGLVTFGKINWWQCLGLLLLSAILITLINEQRLTQRQELYLNWGLFVLYAIIFCSIHFPLTGQVTLIDVGQGDSILITTPLHRRVYLIDTGGKLNFTGRALTPQVNQITIPLLKAQGITQINGLFVTHQDADHIGDLQPLAQQVSIHKLYLAQGSLANPAITSRIQTCFKQKQLVQLLAGQIVVEPQINFQVVYPFKAGSGKNEDSLSLTFQLAHHRWLFTGDLGQDGEQDLMAHYHLHVDYFKLGHHGSRTSSNPAFLRQLAPDLVLISAGRNNRFGHPHPETLATLKSQGIPWVSTQDCGMITWTYGPFTKPKFKRFLPVNYQ